MRSVLRRLLDQAGFSPRQLFAALQGAWLEPKQGLIWQENTGITPTTTGGQTIGLLLDQSQGAVLGPELVTNGTFDANVTGWSSRGSATIAWDASGALSVDITGIAGGFTSAANITMTAGRSYLVSLSVKVGTAPVGAQISVGMPITGATLGSCTLSGTYQTFTFTHLSAGNNILDAARLTAFTGTILVDNISVRQILGNHAYQATAANRPILGRRYNLLTWSEDFSNAAWTKSGSSFVAGKLTEDSSNGLHRLTRDLTATSASHTYVVKAKYAGRAWLAIAMADGGGVDRRAWFNVETGTVGTANTGLTATITPAGDGWYLCKIISTSTYINAYPYIFLSNADSVLTYQGDGSSGVYLGYADLRLTTDVGKDPAYQRITTATDYDYGSYPAAIFDTNDSLTVSLPDLGGGVFSASGSVYFATPVGMSQLNNQSMGTTYTLPALSSDIYSWMVFPQRLNTAQEARLARYMEQRAGIAGPDYLTSDAALLDQLTDDAGDQLLLAQ